MVSRSPHPHLTPVLVGRDELLEDGMEFYRRRIDAGGMLLVDGPRGVGRTRFLEELVSLITKDNDSLVVWNAMGRGTERHPLHPFRAILPWREMISEARSNFPIAELPELEERYLLFSAASEKLGRMLSDSPGILVLDDLHLCDEMSVNLLHYLLVSEVSLLVLSSVCMEYVDPRSSTGQTISLMNRERVVDILSLENLGRRDMERMTSNMLGRRPGDDVLEKIWVLSEGNPSIAVQTIQEFISRGHLVFQDSAWEFAGPMDSIEFPESVEALARERLSSLSPREFTVLRAGSVFGSVFSFGALRNALSSSTSGKEGESFFMVEDDLIDTIEILINKGLLVQGEEEGGSWGDESYSFSAALLHKAAYDSIPPVERTLMHRRAAEALESLTSMDRKRRDFILPMMARHYALGGEKSRALPLFIGAGKRMEAISAHLEAKELHEMAVSILEMEPSISGQLYAQCLLDAGKMSLTADHPADARKHLLNAVDVCKQAGLRKMEIEARIYLDELLVVEEKYDEAESSCLATLQDAVLLGDLEHIGWCFERLGSIYWLRGRLDSARESLENGLSYTMATGDQTMSERITADLGAVLSSRGEYDRALSRFSVALSMLQQKPNRYEETRVLLGMARTHLFNNNLQDAEKGFYDALESASAIGAMRMISVAQQGLADVQLEKGEPDRAEHHIFKVLGAELPIRRIDLARAYRTKGRIADYRGQFETAENLLTEALEIAEESGSPEVKANVLLSLGVLMKNIGDEKRCRVYLDRSRSIFLQMGNEAMASRAADVF